MYKGVNTARAHHHIGHYKHNSNGKKFIHDKFVYLKAKYKCTLIFRPGTIM